MQSIGLYSINSRFLSQTHTERRTATNTRADAHCNQKKTKGKEKTQIHLNRNETLYHALSTFHFINPINK